MRIKIATFNTLHCMNYPHYLKTGKSVIDFDSVAAQIKDMGADICVLNEMRNESTVGGDDQVAAVAERLGYFYHFAKAINLKNGGEYGNAVVSRYPIISARAYPISLPEDCRADFPRYEDRVLISVEIEVFGTVITVLGCHFGLSEAEKGRALEVILQAIEQIKTPIVLAGDFNIFPNHPIIAELSRHLEDSADKLTEMRGTFIGAADKDGKLPFDHGKKIDYLFTSALAVTSATIPEESCSDHRSMYAEIEI